MKDAPLEMFSSAFLPPVPPVGSLKPETHVETTSKPPEKISKIHWMVHKMIFPEMRASFI